MPSRHLSGLLAAFAYLAVWLPARPAAAHHPSSAPSVPVESDAGSEPAVAVNSPTGSTLGQGNGFVGVFWEHARFNAMPARDAHTLHHQNRDVHGKNHEETYAVHAGYGVTADADLYVMVPYASNTAIQIDDHAHLGRGERAAGLGDVRLVGKYRVWKQAVDVSLIAGLKLPTGETSERDQSGAKVEIEQQPGSGSWDGELGIAASKGLGSRASVSTSVQYTLRTEGGQDRKLGDVFRCNVAGSYAVRPREVLPNLHVVLELNHEWALKDRARGAEKVFDSGGTTILATPGVVAQFTDDVSAFLAVPVPVYQNFGGDHEELKYTLLTGVSWSF